MMFMCFSFTWIQDMILKLTHCKKLPFARVFLQFTCSDAGESENVIYLSAGLVSLLGFVVLWSD